MKLRPSILYIFEIIFCFNAHLLVVNLLVLSVLSVELEICNLNSGSGELHSKMLDLGLLKNKLRGCYSLFLDPAMVSNPAGPYPYPFPNPAGCGAKLAFI